ncbi:MAG: serine hydrolase family protein [Alkalibacterium sp.]|nr:serine hydrolase family protein [Alkalibacterium sp.]
MNKPVLFIHSAGPQDKQQGSTKLVTYLQNELNEDHHLIIPRMPDPKNPTYVEWKRELNKQLQRLDEEVILVGHSLGGSVLLKYLSEELCDLTIKGLFVISSPYWGLDDNWQLKDFMLNPHFEKKLPSLPCITLYHSRNENIVPFTHHEAYAEKIPQAILRPLEGNRHLFDEGLPQLVTDINAL